MRISEIAAAAATTPRAVRHYHRLGLLPEPVRPDNGYRDYGMAELTRLMRIRWLADNGLPLGAVAAVFANEHGASDTEDLRADLAALHEEITQRITQLTRKQEGVARMLAAVDAGRRLTALPDEVADAFDRAREQADETELAALDQERDMLEVFSLAGDTPPEMFTWFTGALADPAARTGYRRLLRGWERLRGRPVAQSAELIEQLAQDIAGLLRQLDFDRVVSATADLPHGAPALSQETLVPDPAQRRAVRRAMELLTGTGGGPS
ncbi:MerR family transcriptional regulator [Nocardia flavorosea]|uniref:MerR family DNA-binding transcriptional regulator n=1 Tax=Nocardia flavorosea TaxID=53429 RepID=A0A846YGI3_9NOCA|nr:MerR family transcriptional regulator [Nocardia flavorosea]NKY58077.1 MerR family DNA-binding transcriptional regulator [Nocardia flavorosea]